jgi:hypothetical protein
VPGPFRVRYREQCDNHDVRITATVRDHKESPPWLVSVLNRNGGWRPGELAFLTQAAMKGKVYVRRKLFDFQRARST